MKRIVIIGAGAGGANAALFLARRGCYEVILLEARDHVGIPDSKRGKEKKEDALSLATSWINPGRAGHGFHYIHIPTAIMLMESTIGVLRRYKKIRRGAHLPDNHPIKKGQYFIAKDSVFSAKEILDSYQVLSDHYASLVQKDVRNKVLGEPKNFFRILDPSEYKDSVYADKIAVGVETTEQLIDPALLAKEIFSQIECEENITILTGKKVIKVSHAGVDENGKWSDKPYVVEIADGEKIYADQVVNCAWEGMEKIDETFLEPSERTKDCTNRLKVLAIGELPEELKNSHSKFVCMGPFCMVSNCGDGTALMTYAPVTNLKNYQGSNIDENGLRFLAGKATREEIEDFGKRIIAGVAQYIRGMEKCKLIGVRFGIVKTYGDADIFDPRSAVHNRDYFGVEHKRIGYIKNACIKLMNLNENAKLVAEFADQNTTFEKEIETVSRDVVRQVKTDSLQTLEIFLSRHLRTICEVKDFKRQIDSLQGLKHYKGLTHYMQAKSLVNMSFKDTSPPIAALFIFVATIFPATLARIIADYCEVVNPINFVYYNQKMILEEFRTVIDGTIKKLENHTLYQTPRHYHMFALQEINKAILKFNTGGGCEIFIPRSAST